MCEVTIFSSVILYELKDVTILSLSYLCCEMQFQFITRILPPGEINWYSIRYAITVPVVDVCVFSFHLHLSYILSLLPTPQEHC